MLLQSLVLIAAMLVVTGALLMNGLYSAKAALHQRLMIASQTEMADATARFVSWARTEVEQNGSDPRNWSTMKSAEILPCNRLLSLPQSCPVSARVHWIVSGSTKSEDPTGRSLAENVSNLVVEHRLSATIYVTFVDDIHARIIGSSARQLTARIFAANPYVVITGTRSVNAAAGSEASSEGDSAGKYSRSSQQVHHSQLPISSEPASYTYTGINVVVDCINPPNTSNTLASTSGIAQLIDLRSIGNVAFAFRVPCSPSFTISNSPAGYAASDSNQYQEDSTISIHWNKNDNLK